MSAPKTKKTKTDPEDSVDTVDDQEIQLLESIQEQIEELNDKATEEILEVERKYNRLRKPIYEKRNQAIRKIPEFWMKVSQEMLAALLVGDDVSAFKYLRELNVEDHDDVKSGFKISLTFDPNPFFKNSILSKEFVYDKDGNLTVIPTRIEWKEGKDLTKVPQSNVKGKRARDEESESFFTWFSPEDQDLELAEIIKEDLWPNPAKYYLGLVESFEEAEEEEDEEDDAEEGGEDEAEEEGADEEGADEEEDQDHS